jgi:hypothetical protein
MPPIFHIGSDPWTEQQLLGKALLDHCKVAALKPQSAVVIPRWDMSISFERRKLT